MGFSAALSNRMRQCWRAEQPRAKKGWRDANYTPDHLLTSQAAGIKEQRPQTATQRLNSKTTAGEESCPALVGVGSEDM